MATPPTFNSGDVLNASSMNAIGLWLVKSQTVGSGVSSVTVTGAFNADYDNYKVIYSGGVGSTGNNMRMNLGSAVTNYYGNIIYTTFSSATVLAITTNNGSSCTYVGGGDGSFCTMDVDVLSPFATKPTLVHSMYQDQNAFGNSGYRLADSTSYSSFSIAPNIGTITGGTIYVYGYRKG